MKREKCGQRRLSGVIKDTGKKTAEPRGGGKKKRNAEDLCEELGGLGGQIYRLLGVQGKDGHTDPSLNEQKTSVKEGGERVGRRGGVLIPEANCEGGKKWGKKKLRRRAQQKTKKTTTEGLSKSGTRSTWGKEFRGGKFLSGFKIGGSGTKDKDAFVGKDRKKATVKTRGTFPLKTRGGLSIAGIR